MTSPEKRRSVSSKAFGVVALVAIACLMSWPWVAREWHAWRGHELFVEKRFAQASSHLVHARSGATLYAAVLGLPPMRHLYAQSLLVAGRDADAVRQYSRLADLDPRDGTLALIIAVHDWTSGYRASAVARLEAHRTSTRCRRCKDAHGTFQRAATAQFDIVAAQRQQAAHVASMKLPAQCVLYRGGRVAAGVLSAHVLSSLEGGMDGLLQASGLSGPAIETAVDVTRPLMRKALGEIVEDAAGLAPYLDANCARTAQIHEILRLKEIPLVRDIDAWVALETLERLAAGQFYLREAKEALAAAPHLYQLGVHAVAYASAYKAESDARSLVRAADAHARSEWDAIERAAQHPEFAREGVALIASETPWLAAIGAGLSKTMLFVWPF